MAMQTEIVFFFLNVGRGPIVKFAMRPILFQLCPCILGLFAWQGAPCRLRYNWAYGLLLLKEALQIQKYMVYVSFPCCLFITNKCKSSCVMVLSQNNSYYSFQNVYLYIFNTKASNCLRLWMRRFTSFCNFVINEIYWEIIACISPGTSGSLYDTTSITYFNYSYNACSFQVLQASNYWLSAWIKVQLSTRVL